MVQIEGTEPTPGSVSASHKPVWASLLEDVLRCPACSGDLVVDTAAAQCSACGHTVSSTDGVLDFVEDEGLTEHHHEEMDAQRNAVTEYYENESRICCHWDRLSAEDLPGRLGWPRGRVLDLGCGTGSAGGAIRQSGAEVVGADLSVPCLVEARRRLDAVARTDAARLPFKDGAFDGLVSRGALHHLQAPDESLAEAARVLKPNSPALFLDPREFAWLEPIKDALRKEDESFSHDHHAYGVSEYRDLIAKHFAVEEVYTEHPFGVLLAAGLDLFPVRSILPARLTAAGLFRLDRVLNKTPLRHVGHLLVVRARRR